MPASLVATARCACSSAQLPLERRRDLLRGDRRARARAQLPGMFFVRRSMRLDERPAFARVLRRERHLRQRLVDQERRRHEPARARRLHAAELAVELLRVRLQPRQIRLGVSGVLDAMIAVEEARDVEIGADVLDDDVRRVAPAADRDVAVGEREALERRRIGAAHDLDAGARRRARGRPCRRR